MPAELADAIRLFRHDQELGLDYIHGTLGIPVPGSAYQWATSARDQIASVSASSIDGVTLKVHGAGIEIIHPEFHIDFDYGRAGQCDCFDRWRLSLHRHIRLGLPNPVEDPRPLNEWLRDAVDAEELICVADSYSTFYDPSLRSKWSPPLENVG